MTIVAASHDESSPGQGTLDWRLSPHRHLFQTAFGKGEQADELASCWSRG
jgi:hypothetical protein